MGDSVAYALQKREGYVLQVADGTASVVGADSLGMLHGLVALARMSRGAEGGLPTGVVADWPTLDVRAVHFVARGVDEASARRIIDMARDNQFNTLIINLADGVRLPSMEKIARPDAWSPQTFERIVAYARANGLEVVPELSLLTHQERLLQGAYPNLMYNKDTYDPEKERTYQVVFAMLDDIVAAVHPRAIHIGHDEVRGVVRRSPGVGRRPREEGRPLPARLYLADIERLHAYLSGKGIETWMWGDMLVAPGEFPGMLARHLHADSAYARLLPRLPKDIVICDWHYADRQADFPTVRKLVEAGHPVLGATWDHPETTRAFARYVAGIGGLARGMIATTWSTVQQRDWGAIGDILQVSGAAFWNAGRAKGRATEGGR